MVAWASIGDWGNLGQQQADVAESMAHTASEDPYDFVLAVGDNFYPSGVTSVHDALWKYVYHDVYRTRASIQSLPWYVALGNHDYIKNAQAQIEFSSVDPLWNMPHNYYDFHKGPVHFIVIDTVMLLKRGELYDQHFAWLQQTLRTSESKWIIIAGHHPLYSIGVHGGTAILRRRLMPMFIKYGVDMYIAGHNHNMEHIVSGHAMHHILTGSASKSRPTLYYSPKLRFKTSRAGFTLHRLNEETNTLETDFIVGGDTVYHFTMTPRLKKTSSLSKDIGCVHSPAHSLVAKQLCCFRGEGN